MNSIIVGICLIVCNLNCVIEQNISTIRYENLKMIVPHDQATTKEQTSAFFKKKHFNY